MKAVAASADLTDLTSLRYAMFFFHIPPLILQFQQCLRRINLMFYGTNIALRRMLDKATRDKNFKFYETFLVCKYFP